MDYLADTTFLIHRWREGPTGPEQRFIEAHRDAVLGIPWVVKAEFLRGAVLAGHDAQEVGGFLGRYRVVWPDDETLVIYAATYAALVKAKSMVGPHDLWVAAACLRTCLPLLTRNRDEFCRVPRLEVVAYSD